MCVCVCVCVCVCAFNFREKYTFMFSYICVGQLCYFIYILYLPYSETEHILISHILWEGLYNS